MFARDFLEIHPLGDAALVVKLGDRIDEALNARAQGLAAALRMIRGVDEVVASYASVTVHYEPGVITYRTLQGRVGALNDGAGWQRSFGRLHEISVLYDGPDLEAVADELSISVAQLIELHSTPIYRVFLIGFSPGLPYLGPLPEQLRLPRRPFPRPRVPAGSVAIAGDQTTVYTFPTPGGWHLLGRTSAQLFMPDVDPPALLHVGDSVRFVQSHR